MVTNSAWLGHGFFRRFGSRILRGFERKRRAERASVGCVISMGARLLKLVAVRLRSK